MVLTYHCVQEALQMQTDRATHHKYEKVALEKDCNWEMTFKYTLKPLPLLLLDRSNIT